MGARGAKSILIVDDDALVRRALARTLRDLGVPIREAASGTLALEAIEREEPALVLTDYSMPGMNGRVLAEQVAAKHPEVRIVVHSGNALHVLFGLWWPEFDVTIVPKPAPPEVLRDVITSALSDES